MLFNVKTLKYFKMKRTKLYIFLSSLNKKRGGVVDKGDWKGIVKIFKRLKKKIKMEKIKSNGDFIIYKERYTNSWFLECKELIVIYVIKRDKNGFDEKIKEGNYNFMIYETSFHYICFCTSHSTDKIDDFLKNLVLDYSDKRILLVSNYGKDFSSFIFLNKYTFTVRRSFVDRQQEPRWSPNTFNEDVVRRQGTFNEDVVRRQGTFNEDVVRRQGTFGKGDSSLILKVQIIIKYIIACKYLSPHYFPIS
jgi:hypothetical protein